MTSLYLKENRVIFMFPSLCFGWPHIANANGASDSFPVFVYKHDQLISLRLAASEHTEVLSDIFLELRRGNTKRGCRGGAKVRVERAAKYRKQPHRFVAIPISV